MLRVNVRGGYGGLACARDGMHGSWRKCNCVGSAGCADKCVSSADKCVGSVDKCAGCVDKSVGCVYTLK